MDDMSIVQTIAEGPQLELWPEERTEFKPLELSVHPGGELVEVSRPDAIIGRHSRADIVLAFPEVSRRHCRLMFLSGQWRVFDLNSTNGVWVNGERMHDAVIYDGDRVRVGSCVLTVQRGTPLRVVKPPRKTDPDFEVLQSIAEVLPRQAG